jgi:RIO kinase 1
MSYVGDDADAAAQLQRYRIADAAEPEDLLDRCLRAVELMLFHDVIHGDLSPFNLLVWAGRVHVIDLAQAVDPKKNRHAESLLRRDVARTCEFFERRGVVRDATGIADDLWTAWTLADLIPEELRPAFESDPITG